MGLGDLYCAQELIDDAIESGNTLPPWAIVIEAPEPEAIDESFAYIDEILDMDCDAPIVVFCDERTLRKNQALDQLGFAKFLWTRHSPSSMKPQLLQHGNCLFAKIATPID